jgi:hypothetical protein
MIVSIHTKSGWKYVVVISLMRGMLTTTRQHVYRDLHIAVRSTTATSVIVQAHRTSWHCIEACGKTFAAESEFESHVQRDHTDLVNMLSVLPAHAAPRQPSAPTAP